MRPWQQAGSNAVVSTYRQSLKPLPLKMRGEVMSQVEGNGKLSQAHLGGNFPGRSGAYQNVMVFVGDEFACGSRQGRIFGQPPEQGVRIQQKTHCALLPPLQFVLRQRLEELRTHMNLSLQGSGLAIAA